MRVYHIGYNTPGALEYLNMLMQEKNVILVDVRYKSWSWDEKWRYASLKFLYGARYCWVGHILGNRAYATQGMDIVDMHTGIKLLTKMLTAGYDLVLLCQCSHTRCHRYVILKSLQEAIPELEIRGQHDDLRLSL